MEPSQAPKTAKRTGPNNARRRRQRVADAVSLLVALDAGSGVPLHRQIYESLRADMLTGRLAAGARLPSTRVLASELGVARNTVVLAFDQLFAEGYLSTRRGGGTRVRAGIPDTMMNVHATRFVPAERAHRSVRPAAPRLPSRWTRALADLRGWGAHRDAEPVPFALGVPAIDAFPAALWARLTARRWRSGGVFLGHAAAAGDRTLRGAIAEYVTSARGARCGPHQVVIVSGAQQALDLVARVLVDPGDPVWMEDPGYLGARAAFVAAGARVVPIPVDDEGMNVAHAERTAKSARLAYVTPSHQFPLGIIMSAARRLALLTWAHRVGGWILEDDYDSEFRYAGRPIPCLQGLDAERATASRVLYVGTFSKTLSPALRLGYLIVPDDLVDTFRGARAVSGGHSPTVDQSVLADFIGEGHYVRHVRRVRALCAERQGALVRCVERELAGAIELAPDAAGLHMVGWLPGRASGAAAAHAAQQRGVDATPLSRYSAARPRRDALLLGYAAFDESAMRTGARGLARSLGSRR